MRWILAATLAMATMTTSAMAGTNDTAKIAGHLAPHIAKASPCISPPLPPCNAGESALTVTGAIGVGYDLYLFILDGSSQAGVSGAAFGIAYDEVPNSGVDVFGWTGCSDLAFPYGPPGTNWPDSGSGNLLIWDRESNCQRSPAAGDDDGDVTVCLGAFYVFAYSPDTFQITPRTYVPSPDFDVTDCNAEASHLPYPEQAGLVGFGSNEGYDPCSAMQSSNDSNGGGNPGSQSGTIWSSGFDPREEPLRWPVTVQVGPNQAVLNADQLYTAGDQIIFTFAAPSTLLANGRVWAVCVSPTQPPAPPGTVKAWLQELYTRYLSSTKSTNGDKIRDAFSKVDHSHLDPSEPPDISENRISVSFVNWDDDDATLVLTPPPTPQEIEDRARMKVRIVLAGMRSGAPFVFINSAGRNGSLLGASATELLPILGRAKAGLATDVDLQIASEHSISGVVRQLQERAGQ